jgi:hypothetical protein
MEFYNNKKNESLKFKINMEGIDSSNIEARLVFKSDNNINHIIFGKIKETVCTFDIPELKLYEKNQKAN